MVTVCPSWSVRILTGETPRKERWVSAFSMFHSHAGSSFHSIRYPHSMNRPWRNPSKSLPCRIPTIRSSSSLELFPHPEDQPVHFLHIALLYGTCASFTLIEPDQAFQVIKVTVFHVMTGFVGTIRPGGQPCHRISVRSPSRF